MTNPPDEWAGLIERLEAAEAGSRELDRAVWSALEFDHDGEPTKCPAYTTSLDAALALAERVLPGWGFVLSTGAAGQPAWAQAYPEPVDEDICRDATAAGTRPLAVCLSILKATAAAETGAVGMTTPKAEECAK
jgi:hypothetical protein